jgi:hypothetical protein
MQLSVFDLRPNQAGVQTSLWSDDRTARILRIRDAGESERGGSRTSSETAVPLTIASSIVKATYQNLDHAGRDDSINHDQTHATLGPRERWMAAP